MARPLVVEAVDELRRSTSAETQLAALKKLKNGAIGHPEKKGELVRHGVVPILAQLLQSNEKSRGKRRDQAANGASSSPGKAFPIAEEDDVRVQVLLLLATLAQGGPAFTSPIIAGGIIPLLIDALSPSRNSTRIVAASIKVLLYLAQAGRYATPRAETLQSSSAIDALYSIHTVQALAETLMQRSNGSIVHSQLSHLYRYITETCITESQCNALVSGGILDLLAARVASYHAHQDPLRLHPSTVTTLPPPPSHRNLPHLLSAMSAILNHSKFRVARLLYSPPILNVFPFHKPDLMHDPSRKVYGLGSSVSALELDLPQLHYKSENGFARAFPTLGAAQAAARLPPDQIENSSYLFESASRYSGFESSLVPWLLHTIRSEDGIHRAAAADLLSNLYLAEFVNKSRERLLGLVVVPLLLSMVDEKFTADEKPSLSNSIPDSWLLREKVPCLLKTFLEKNQTLQKAAFETNALKKVEKLLKKSFEAFEPRPPAWPTTEQDPMTDVDSEPSRILGAPGLKPELVHMLKCRKAALLLLAGVAEKEDKYRKPMIEGGVVGHIVESFTPFKEDMIAEIERQAYAANKQKIQPSVLGNTIEVILAALAAARAVSRSVGLLRTALIDAGLAKPAYTLLQHPNVAVVKAATDVVCNIITEFSPMRDELLDAGVVRTLCDHARSADSQVRLVSLWALKHLMLKSQNEIKTSCLDELGTGWLVQILQGGSNPSRTSKTTSHPAMSAANAAGERIDILNAVNEPMDTDDDSPSPTNNPPRTSAIQSTSPVIDSTILSFLTASTPTDASPETTANQYLDRVKTFKEGEERYSISLAYADDLRIQSQCLDIIRNMVLPPMAAEMIDWLVQNLSGATIWDIVASKLKQAPSSVVARPRVVGSGSGSGAGSGGGGGGGDGNGATTTGLTFTAQAETDAIRELLDAAVHTLVHLCAGEPRHRQSIVAQPSLLRPLIPLFQHPERNIRAASIWVIINLTWWDNEADRVPARARAAELRKLGFEERLWEVSEDEVQDVRQRAQTARDQIGDLLDGSSGNRRSAAVI